MFRGIHPSETCSVSFLKANFVRSQKRVGKPKAIGNRNSCNYTTGLGTSGIEQKSITQSDVIQVLLFIKEFLFLN